MESAFSIAPVDYLAAIADEPSQDQIFDDQSFISICADADSTPYIGHSYDVLSNFDIASTANVFNESHLFTCM